MQEVFKDRITDFVFTNNLQEDSYNFLIKHHRHIVAEHSRAVAEEGKNLARRFGVREELAKIAGLLHDISAVFPNEERLGIAKRLGLEILEEEREFPLLLHQKISAVMAQEIWNIHDKEVLNAIQCHTTLKKDFSRLDLVLFVADKIKWDQKGTPPYIEALEMGLNISLEEGARAYINYLIDHKTELKVVHPWLMEAYTQLNQ